MNDRRPRLHALTSLRFFAALWVVVFHCGWRFFERVPLILELPRQCGYVAVTFFFVLSGFILTYNHATQRVDLGAERPAWRRDFWVARCARIYPIYFLGELLMAPFVILYAPAGKRAASFVAHALLIQGWFPSIFVSWNFPGWSLCVEAFFYLLFPWLLRPLLGRVPIRKLLVAMIALWAADLLFPALYLRLDPDGLGPTTLDSSGPWLHLVRYAPLTRLPELVMGMCLGKLYLADLEAGRRRRGMLWTILALLALAPLLVLHRLLPFPMFHNGLLAPLFAMLILGLAHADDSVLARALALRPLVTLGEASYALYILQLPVALYAIWLWGGEVGALMGGMPAALLLPYLCAVIAASLLAHRFVERPAQAFIRRRLARSPG